MLRGSPSEAELSCLKNGIRVQITKFAKNNKDAEKNDGGLIIRDRRRTKGSARLAFASPRRVSVRCASGRTTEGARFAQERAKARLRETGCAIVTWRSRHLQCAFFVSSCADLRAVISRRASPTVMSRIFLLPGLFSSYFSVRK